MKQNKSMELLAVLLFTFSCLQAQDPKGPPKKEERIKRINEKIEKEIQLTNMQKTTISAAFNDFFNAMDKLREKNHPAAPPPPPPPPGNKAEVEKLSKKRDDQIKQVLSAAQFKKYQELEKTLRPPAPPVGKQGKSDKPAAPPYSN